MVCDIITQTVSAAFGLTGQRGVVGYFVTDGLKGGEDGLVTLHTLDQLRGGQRGNGDHPEALFENRRGGGRRRRRCG